MTETTPPYEQWTVRELRDELRTRNLSTSGTPKELAARLWEADEKGKAAAGPRPETAKPADKAADKAADKPARTDDKADEPKTKAKAKRAPGECVVDDGTAHTGRATPGAKICSAHAMHYRADGTLRTG